MYGLAAVPGTTCCALAASMQMTLLCLSTIAGVHHLWLTEEEGFPEGNLPVPG